MNDNLKSVIEGLRWIRDEKRVNDPSFQRPAIPYLIGATNAASTSDEKSMLLSLLAIEYGALGLTEQQLYALKSSAELSPSDPSPWIALSDFHRLNGESEQAISAANTAVGLAKVAGRFHRHALQTLARSLRDSNKYNELDAVLDILISLPSSALDSAVEVDFLVNLPDGVISLTKVDAYRNLRRS